MHSFVVADRESERVGRGQDGVITRTQLLDAGHTPRSIGTRLSSGYLTQLHPKVYGLSAVPDSFRKRLTAAYLWAQPGGFLSHRSAAYLHGLDGIKAGFIDVSMTSSTRRHGINCHRLGPSDRPRLKAVGHLKVTWVERTLLDLGVHVSPRATGLALDDALRKRMTTLPRLWRELEITGGSGKAGSRTLRDLLQLRDDRDGKLESQLEAAALTVMRDRRLPPVTPQYVVAEVGAHAPRLDFAYPSCRIGIEAHSYRWHVDPDRMKRDAARDNRLKLLGWVVLHYTWDDLHFERERVLSEIRRLLVQRGALLV